jgi:hypothetical protein
MNVGAIDDYEIIGSFECASQDHFPLSLEITMMENAFFTQNPVINEFQKLINQNQSSGNESGNSHQITNVNPFPFTFKVHLLPQIKILTIELKSCGQSKFFSIDGLLSNLFFMDNGRSLSLNESASILSSSSERAFIWL